MFRASLEFSETDSSASTHIRRSAPNAFVGPESRCIRISQLDWLNRRLDVNAAPLNSICSAPIRCDVIEILIKIVSITFLMTFAFAIGFGLWRVIEIPLRRWRESAFDYVYVDDNGNARDLNAARKNM